MRKTGFTTLWTHKSHIGFHFCLKRKPMKVNYLHMIWDVKIYLAKIKDCKGKDLILPTKKSLLTITRPKYHKEAIFRTVKTSILHPKTGG
jgi:hypothetical protein